MIRMKVGGVEVTLIALRNAQMTIRDAAPLVVAAGGLALANMVRRRITLTDHTLADLAKLDHPYARRHRQIRIHTEKPWQVHRQTGRMARALEHSPIVTPGGNPGYQVTFNWLRAPHAEDVIRGTRVMLPRDVLWQTANEDETDLAIMRAIIDTLGRKFRTKLGVRFDQGTPRSALFPGGNRRSVG